VEVPRGLPRLTAVFDGFLDSVNRKLASPAMLDFHDAIAGGRGQEVTQAALAQVVNYTIYQFAAEENLMQPHDFLGTAAHRIKHNNLTLKISQLQKEHAAGKPGTAESFLRFLQQWLEEHMLKTDKEYVQFLCSKGVV